MIINSKEDLLVTIDGKILSQVEYDLINENTEVMFKSPPAAGAVIKIYKRKETNGKTNVI